MKPRRQRAVAAGTLAPAAENQGPEALSPSVAIVDKPTPQESQGVALVGVALVNEPTTTGPQGVGVAIVDEPMITEPRGVAIVDQPATTERPLELQRKARRSRAAAQRRGALYDVRFLAALFVLAILIVGIGLWELLSQTGTASPSSISGAVLPGNGVNLPGGPLLPILVSASAVYLVLRRLFGTPAMAPAREKRRGRGWRWIYDPRVIASVIAALLSGYGFSQLAPPGASPDIREIPGEVSNAIQAAAAQPETGYPRIKLSSVSIDLLLVKGDGKTPPVKYEAFTYPGADHLLTGTETGGSNTYVYAHARNGMFWRLHDLHIGNIVDVDYGDSKILHYRVSEIHPRVNWRDLNWLQPTTDDRLTLQTCNGWKDDDPRFVVVARRVPDKTALAG